MAFHPRPQIASDLGRNVTRSFNPHRNRSQFPSGNEILAYGRRFNAAGLNPLRFENRKPNPPLFTGDLNSPNRKPAGRNRRIRAAKRPQIAESPATRPLRYRVNLGGGGNVLQSVLSKTTFGGLRNWGWSVRCLFLLREVTESRQKGGGGETYRRWGVQKRFWGGVFRRIYGVFSTPLSFPPPLAAL